MTESITKIEPDQEEEPFGLGCALEVFSEFKEVCEMIDNLKNIYQDPSLNEGAYEKYNAIISQYNEQPHLLDKNLDELLEKFIAIIRNGEYSMDLKHNIFRYLHVVINVRSYKIIVRHLPHEVADFEVVLKMLEQQDPNHADTWTTRYVLLLWMSIIIMIPFDLNRFDGFMKEDHSQKAVMERVLDIIKTYSVVSDKCMDAAAYLSSRFISRSDVKNQHLSSFIDWAIELTLSEQSNVFTKQGILSSVAMILKHGKREDLLPYAQKLLQWIVNDEIKNNSGSKVQKLVYKIVQRIGLIFLPTKIASWRYRRGNRSLAANLSGGDSTHPSSQASTQADVGDEEDIDVPDEIEEVIDQLMQGLRSGDSIVRWTAAKGVGRVTGRLPRDLADEVVGSVLELFSPRESDGAWHGGCLSLAELGRRGLLLPGRLPEVVAVVVKALVYDEPRGYSSVGSHIRDAACYVCWAFARAYDTEVLKPYVNEIAATLLVVTCFDREINCRRAASAAFQENVGRQGTFPHGIDILTVADFFAVSVRNTAYLSISVYIAQFNEYAIPLIDHLLHRKVDHWDCGIRELVAKSLHNLAPTAVDFIVEKVLPKLCEKTKSIDLNSRHGAVLAIGEIIYSLAKTLKGTEKSVETILGSELIEQVCNLIPGFRAKFYFRGMGGELMRQACCDFIEKCSLAALNFHKDELTTDWLNLINECVAYNVPTIQSAAIKALPVLLTEYFREDTQTQQDLVKKYIHEMLTTSQQECRMGHALALGALPKFIVENHLEQLISALIESTAITPIAVKWAESRRDAIKALTSICITMSDEIGHQLNVEQVKQIYSVFLNGLTDYTQDKRGDVGAWIREASIFALQTLTMKIVENNLQILEKDLVEKIMSGIAQQAVEKIDRTRALAAKVFYSLLHNEIAVPNVANFDELTKIFAKDECDKLNWNSAAATFPKFVELLQFDAYVYKVMLGTICSVGGLTETLVKNASLSLFNYLQKIQRDKGLAELNRMCDVIHQIFKDHLKNDRVTVALFRFLDKLFSSGCIQVIIEDGESDVAKKLLKLILFELNGCKDVYKLIDGIHALAQFVQVKNDACQTALVQLSILLCHRQTYVRKTTSTVLYEALLVYGDNANFNTGNLDEIMQILSCTNWEEPVEVVKPIRNQLCILMGIRVPVAKVKT